MKEVDARGLACPMPVVMTKREIDAGERLIQTRVDNSIAVENLKRLAESQGYSAAVREEHGTFEVMLTKTGAAPAATATRAAAEHPVPEAGGGWALLVGGEHLGRGADELGATLMAMFFYTLSQSDSLPVSILFLNGGVKLTTENDDVVAHLKALEQQGCEVLSCGACLDYYHLKDKLQAGTVSNMYEITLRLQRAAKVITL